jgi:hypothetical protein
LAKGELSGSKAFARTGADRCRDPVADEPERAGVGERAEVRDLRHLPPRRRHWNGAPSRR